jgi:hypothetical protein
MASTLTFTAKTVFGDQRVFMGTMTATDGTDEVASGLKFINFGTAMHASVAGAVSPSNLVINSTTNGTIKLTTGISGGVYNILLIGK